MKRKIFRIILMVFIILFIVLLTVSDASSVISDIESNMDYSGSAATTIKSTGRTVLGLLEVIGAGVAIVMLMGIAIKYIIAAPDEKADVKKTAVPFVIGAVIIFAAPRLASVVMKISQNVTGKLG